ncbi:hypothetical protein JTE90_029117, partial [Oedothorax gibbosus]
QPIRKKNVPPIVPSTPRVLLPEEEYSIRNLCPLTLNHLLPDLRLTTKEFLEDAMVDFDSDLRRKFEKHLEDSHKIMSGSSSDIEEGIKEDINDNKIENDLSSVESKKRYSNRVVLNPSKVNYPQEKMKMLLPDMQLNNKRSASPILTKNFCTGCINRGMSGDDRYNKNKLQYNQNKKVYSKDVDYGNFLPPMLSKETFLNEKKSNFDRNILCDFQIENMDYYEKEGKYLEDRQRTNLENKSSTFYNPSNNVIRSSPPSSLPVANRRQSLANRSRSMSPDKFRSLDPGFSPYMLELARLQKERLRIEERMMLRRRQVMELERLRPPLDRW